VTLVSNIAADPSSSPGSERSSFFFRFFSFLSFFSSFSSSLASFAPESFFFFFFFSPSSCRVFPFYDRVDIQLLIVRHEIGAPLHVGYCCRGAAFWGPRLPKLICASYLTSPVNGQYGFRDVMENLGRPYYLHLGHLLYVVDNFLLLGRFGGILLAMRTSRSRI
jgi:hypothetical protein